MAPTKAQKIAVFAITFFGYSMLHAMRTAWSYSKKQIQKDGGVHFTNKQLGYVDMTFMLCYSIGLGFIGPLGDRINRKYFLAIGYYTCGTAFLIFPTIYKLFGFTNIYFVILFMGINGLGQSVGMPGSMGVLANWFKGQNKGMIIGFWAGCCNFGNIFGLITSTVIHQYLHLEWEDNFFFAGLCTLAMATIILLFLKPDPDNQGNRRSLLESTVNNNTVISIQEEQKKTAITVFEALKIPRVIHYIIAYSCLKGSIYGLLFWLPKYISDHGMDTSSGYIPSMTEVGTFFGGIIIGHLGDKYVMRSFFLSPLIILSTSMMLVAKYVLSNDPLPYYFVILLMGFGLGGPYNIIGTVMAVDLGSNKELKGNTRSISTVTAIIDSVGAMFSAATQLFLGYFSTNMIFLLFACYTFTAAAALTPLILKDYKILKSQQQMSAKQDQN